MAFIFSVRYLKFTLSILFILLISTAYLIITYIGIIYFDQPNDLRFESLVILSFVPVCIFVAYVADSEIKQRKLLKSALKNVESVTQEREAAMQRLSHVAATDELTELVNRRAMRVKLEEELSRLKRYHTQFCILLIDVDHFKKVNDQHGHQIGDAALIHLANTMQSSIRNTDVLARWGGEEFLVLIPNAELADATVIARQNMPRSFPIKLINRRAKTRVHY